MSFTNVKFASNHLSYLETDERLVQSFLYAAVDGDVKKIDRMLRDGMPVDVSDGYDCTALDYAAMHNRTDVIKHLIDQGADVNRQDRVKETPLHNAARNNYTKVTRLLLNNGVDINLEIKFNLTPVDCARTGSEVERLLLQHQQNAPKRYK